MRVAVGNDHAGSCLRAVVLEVINSLGHQALDFGSFDEESCDYPDYACQVAEAVRTGRAELGVLICANGLGMAITANKVRGVYATPCRDSYSARLARSHNGANVLTLGGQVLGPGWARETLTTFLQTEVSEELRHERRRQKVAQLEAASGAGQEAWQ